jgi:hypothetical protein
MAVKKISIYSFVAEILAMSVTVQYESDYLPFLPLGY